MIKVTRLFPLDRRVKKALRLAEEVFTEFDAPLFPPYAGETFIRFLHSRKLKTALLTGSGAVYICEIDGVLAGMAAVTKLRNRRESHLSLLFVKGEYQRKGAGRELVKRIMSDFPRRSISVNAAPPGYEFYKSMGFEPQEMETMADGLIFTKMICPKA
ncbi:MAG: GNAT family N-acetyltransferase [Ruminococcus sp.]|nr:GNAT family N-acetyltransferase [Ruminococcus sp.]